MDYEMDLSEPHFSLMKDKIKTYEMRANDDKRKPINIGDTIIYNSKNGDKFKRTVFNRLDFKTFKEGIYL